MTTPRPTCTPEDSSRADEVLRLWAEDCRARQRIAPAREQRSLRGILIAAFALARHEAYADALADYRAASTDPEPARPTYRGVLIGGRTWCDGSCGMVGIWGDHDPHVPA